MLLLTTLSLSYLLCDLLHLCNHRDSQVKVQYTRMCVHMYTGVFGSSSPPRTVLSDAGWHCSWCFAALDAFLVKFAATSHQEHNDVRLRAASRIQAYICRGAELYDNWFEYYTFGSALSALAFGQYTHNARLEPPRDYPRFLGQHAHAARLQYLVPGNCVRPATSTRV